MFSCSVLVIIRKHSDYAVAGLMGVVITQALGYGLIFDLNFFLRNLSVIGGLVMVLSDSWVRKTQAFAGLPEIAEKDRKMYFQLAGRVLLIFLFVGFVFSGKWSLWRVLVSALGGVACVMVVVGFKAKYSATLLVVILSVFNLLVNNFWTVSECSRMIVRAIVSNSICSCTSTTPTRILPSTTSSRSCQSSVDFSSLSTAAPASSAMMRKRRSTKWNDIEGEQSDQQERLRRHGRRAFQGHLTIQLGERSTRCVFLGDCSRKRRWQRIERILW